MANQILAFAQQQAQAAARRAGATAAFGFAAAILFVFALAALFAALFFWLMPLYGPFAAALIVAAVAFVLGLIALAPLTIKRTPPPSPPPPSPDLPQILSFVAQTAPAVGAKRLGLAAILAALAVGLVAGGSSGKRK